MSKIDGKMLAEGIDISELEKGIVPPNKREYDSDIKRLTDKLMILIEEITSVSNQIKALKELSNFSPKEWADKMRVAKSIADSIPTYE